MTTIFLFCCWLVVGQRVEAVAKKIGSKHDHQVNFSNELTEQPDHMRKAVGKNPSAVPSGQVERDSIQTMLDTLSVLSCTCRFFGFFFRGEATPMILGNMITL